MIKRIARVTPLVLSHIMVKCMICIMNVELGICEISVLKRKNRARLMDKLSTQDIGVGAMTTLVDRRVSGLANRSHSQEIVVVEDVFVEGRTDRIIGSKEVKQLLWNVLKFRKRDFALIAAHAKLGIVVRGV